MESTGSYGWANSLVVQLSKLDHANVEFCLEADAPTRHFACLVLRGWENQGKDGMAFPRLANEIHSQPRRDLVRRFWDIEPGGGLMRFLGRLGPRTMPRRAYDALGAVLGDPVRRRLAAQKPRLSAADLSALAQHDIELVKAVGMDAVRHLGAGVLEHAIQAVVSRRADLDREQILCRIQGLTDETELGEAVCALLADCRLFIPWAGTARIRPLRSLAAMSRTARRFRNCLGDPETQWRALRGDAAFYVCDDGPLVAELRRDRVARRWYLHELLSSRNGAPSPHALGKATMAFNAAGYQRLNLDRLPWANWF